MKSANAVILGLALLASSPAVAQDKPARSPPKPAADPAAEWKDHTGDIPFIVGSAQGMKEVEFSGRPAMFFYTAHG